MGSQDLVRKIRLLLLSGFGVMRPRFGSRSHVRHFSNKDIRKATNGFKRVVLTSPEGASYKAVFENGVTATVKEFRICHENDHAFYMAVHLFGRLHHRHIVAIVGFSSGPKRYLVFENMEYTSLKEYLSDPLKTPLNWRTRLQIATGVAAALEYLHFFCDPPVYDVSITSRNILLDENLVPKISDAVLLSTTAGNPIPQRASSSCCSKECTKRECKNMVFQLGLLILELITGQSSEKGSGVDLVEWVGESHCPRSMNRMIDPDLGDEFDKRELVRLLNVARLCVGCVDKAAIQTCQILRYLQKKIGINRKHGGRHCRMLSNV